MRGRRHGHGPGGGGPGWRFGRKLGAADLQLLILALLARQPAHGYELIRAIEAHSDGFYTPSPGMIYPALTYLDEIGHAAASVDGARKRYTITDAGRAALAEERAIADRLLDDLARIGARMAAVRAAFEGRAPAENEDAATHDFVALEEARHAIRHAVHQKHGCRPEEARRLAEILWRAVAEINKDPS